MPEPSADTTPIRRSSEAKEHATQVLWQLSGSPGQRRQSYVYAVLDAARDRQIYPRLRRLAATELIASLYQGRAATEYAVAAPYLICLGDTDRVFDWLWNEGWGNSWGVYVWSLVAPDALRAHLRRLTFVRREDGARMLFRFYDPRVLAPFLPTCDAAQLREMFGPIQRYMMEYRDGEEILTYRLQGTALTAERRPLRGEGSDVAAQDGERVSA